MSARRARLVNGALVLGALALSAAVVVTGESVTTSEKLSREGSVLTVFRPEQISSIVLTRLGDAAAEGPRELRLVRDANSSDRTAYFLGAPGGTLADGAAVSDLLAALEYGAWLRTIEPNAVDRATFGLDKPSLELRLEMGPISYRLLIGGPAPTPQGAFYAELGGSNVGSPGVGIVSGQLVEKLAQNFHGFVGKLLLPYAKSDLSELRLTGEGGERIIRRDAVGFRLGGAQGSRLDDAAVDRLLFQMARVSAERYAEPSAVKKALASGPRVRIEQIPLSGPAVSVEVGGACPVQGGGEPLIAALRVSAPELAGCVPATVLPSLTASADELVLRTPFAIHADEVDHVTIAESTETGPRRLELMRAGSGFELIEPSKEKVELDAGNDLVKALTSPLGTLFAEERAKAADGAGALPNEPDLGKLGLAPPRGTVTLRGLREGTQDPVDQVVTFSRADHEGRVWLRREDDGAVLALSRNAAWAFSTDDGWARPRELIPVDKDSITRVEVESDGGRQVIERRDKQLTLVEPAGFELDGVLASDWMSSLAHLHAERWLEKDEGEPLLKPQARGTGDAAEAPLRVRVTYSTPSGERRASFSVTDRTVGGYRSHWDGPEPGWFVLAAEAERALTTLPISRFALTVNVDALQRLVIEGPDGSRVLERRAGELASVDGSLSHDDVTELEQALSSLRPEAALHVGPPRAEEGFDKPELVLSGTVHRLGQEEKSFKMRFGRITSRDLRTVQYARADGVDATFLIERSAIERILDLL